MKLYMTPLRVRLTRIKLILLAGLALAACGAPAAGSGDVVVPPSATTEPITSAQTSTLPEPDSLLGDIVDRPADYVGDIVTVTAEVVEAVPGSHLAITDLNLSEGSVLPVVTLGPGEPVAAGDLVEVTGEVRLLDLFELEQELGVSLEEAALLEFEGRPVIVASEVLPAAQG